MRTISTFQYAQPIQSSHTTRTGLAWFTTYSLWEASTSGKSNRLEVFRFLAYRNWTSSDITSANIYQLLGSREEGTATICEDEADNLDLNLDKMRIYKLGYTTGRYILRIDNEHA